MLGQINLSFWEIFGDIFENFYALIRGVVEVVWAVGATFRAVSALIMVYVSR